MMTTKNSRFSSKGSGERPTPTDSCPAQRPDPGTLFIVFGHRRVRAAKELGRPVRAVVKTMDDTAHVIAQGQENTRRKDYSFIEKALFPQQQLMQLGHPKDVARATR